MVHLGMLARRAEQGNNEAAKPLALQSVSVEAQAFDFSAQVRVTQLYTHPHSTLDESAASLDLEYKFPLAGDAAVVAFEARIEPGGRVLHGLVKEKEAAAAAFKSARQSGKQALLLESSSAEHAADFSVKIGLLRPGQSLHVTITYVQTLALEGREATRMVIPACIAPRYEPNAYVGWRPPGGWRPPEGLAAFNSKKVRGSFDFIEQMAAAAAPPHAASASSGGSGDRSVPEAIQVHQPPLLSISATFLMPDTIADVTSPSHPGLMRAVIDPPGEGEGAAAKSGSATATLQLDAACDGRASLERDLVLLVHQSFQPARAVLEVDPATGDQCVQLSFCPESFDAELDAASLQVEMLFLIDQSGSMGGSSIAAVRETLQLFLRSLPVHCRFNIIGFGSAYRTLFPKSAPYSARSLATATAYVAALEADLGGTEIYDPLFWCLADGQPDPAYPRQIFVLTDGQVSNAAQIRSLAAKYCGGPDSATRVFTFGIGDGVDRELVTGLARAGKGEAEFVADTSGAARAELNSKVMRQLVRSLQPSLAQVQVDWAALGGGEPASVASASASSSSSSVSGSGEMGGWMQCPQAIPAIFPPARSLLYCTGLRMPLPSSLLAPGGADTVVHIKVTAQSNRRRAEGEPASQLEWLVPLSLTRVQHGSFLHKLAARARIGELQAGPRNPQSRPEILRLALSNSLASSATSFLIVDADPIRAAEDAELADKFAEHVRVAQGDARERHQAAVKLPDFNPPSHCGPVPKHTSGVMRSSSSSRSMAAPMGMLGSSRGGRGGSCGGARGGRGGSSHVLKKTACMATREEKKEMAAPARSLAKKDEAEMEVDARGDNQSFHERDELFQRLVQLQQADGSWTLNVAFAQLLQAHATHLADPAQRQWATVNGKADVLIELAQKFSLQPDALASLLALWLFAHGHADRADEVRMMAGKAKSNLRSKLAVPLDTIPTLLQQITA